MIGAVLEGQQPDPVAPGFAAADGPEGAAALPDAAVEHLQGPGGIRLNIGAESIDVAALIDYVAMVLGVNIIPDPTIAQQQVMFRAPLEIPKEKLLPLLAAIVEDKGFALVEDPLLGYFVKQVQNIPVAFDSEVLATTRIIRTPLVRPSAVQSSLSPLLGQMANLLRFSPLDELGVLIVTGAPRAVEAVERYVDSLLDELSGQRLHAYTLTNVEAGYARSRVLTLNGQLGAVPAAAPAPGAAAVAGGLSNLGSRLILEQGNRLIFRGTDEEAIQVEQLIRLVDALTPLTSRRYSAGSVAMDVATAGEREGLGPITQTQTETALAPVGRLAAAVPGVQAEAQVSTSGFSVDTATGAIIYTGTEAQHKRVAELVKNFTEQIVGSRIDIRRYKLHNADAESVVQILTQLIQDDSQQAAGTSPFIPASRVQGLRAPRAPAAAQPAETGETGEEGAGALLASPVEISIVSDTERNQIIVKAPARQQAQIEQIIRDLDERRPQVYVEAQIVAITTNDDVSWAVETQINVGQFLLFSNFGLSTAGTAVGAQQAAQAPRVVGTGNSGLTTAIIRSEYVPFILNTLQSKTNGKIISNPRILVNDNETGELSSEREEPFATTTQGTATTTTGQGGVATAGTFLTVTPRISKGGYISLEYEVELSSFVGQPTAGLQPPTQRERYSSQVTIPSDSTIVVGGFSLTQNTESDRGIPILKDIPIIGMLFKALTITKRRTTIFVFITPRIMTDPNFIDLRLASEGPIHHVGVEGITPPLEPVRIPISPTDDAARRRLPVNEAAERP